MQFSRSMAIVMGPTPPGTGVIQPAIGLTGVEIDVAGELAVGKAVDAHVDDAGSGFDHIGADQFRAADRGNQYVGLAGDLFKVPGSRMADRDRGVLLQQEQRERLADDVGSARRRRRAARRSRSRRAR